ncbi:diguanylate cyclase [Trinickia sp.]|uniref:GGDEF domain-containing protein n=1 Tax=Trinickia sp. TaxID=2571163 RepID=UPI003F7E4E86
MRASDFFRTMPITRVLAAISVCVFAVVLLPLGWLLAHEWAADSRASIALAAFDGYRATLLVMEKVSVERGPTNGALGEDLPIPAVRAQALSRARAESDRRIAELLKILQSPACPDHCDLEAARIRAMQADLAVRRASVDALLALPLAERRPAAIREAVAGMIAVIPELAPPLDDVALTVLRGSPDTLYWLLATRLLADYREFAGQLGSQFTAALAADRPLTTDELFAIERLRGRLTQLQVSIHNCLATSAQPFAVLAAFSAMQSRYDGTGIRYVERVRNLAMRGEATDISPARFAAEYVPPMRSITDLRDVLLDLSRRQLEVQRQQAQLRLLVTLGASIVIAGALAAILSIVRERIVVPLRLAARTIDAMAGGDLNADVPAIPQSVEVAELLRSIAVLNASRIEKMKVESLRDRLLAEMKRLSETDALTGLPNRRAIDKQARQWSRANTDQSDYAVVVFDLDHFKRINDTYGHNAGDSALRAVADLSRQIWRDGDIIARVGGEEFVALMRVPGEHAAIAAAERLRAAIEQTRVVADDGRTFSFTASFGVAWWGGTGAPDFAHMMRLADENLYGAKSAGRNRVVARVAAQDRNT